MSVGSIRPRVLLADDHPAVLERATALLNHDFDIVATVADGSAAIDAVSTLRPDVVVLDISMPKLTGLDAASILLRLATPPEVVFLTVHEDEDFLLAAQLTGAKGYVLKRRMALDLVKAVHEVLVGRPFLSPRFLSDAHVNEHSIVN